MRWFEFMLIVLIFQVTSPEGTVRAPPPSTSKVAQAEEETSKEAEPDEEVPKEAEAKADDAPATEEKQFTNCAG